MVQARAPTGAKLVRSTGQGRCPGGYLASKAVVLKGQGGVVRRVRLPIDPLPLVCAFSAKESSAGPTTIPLQITLGRQKVRRQVCCQRPRNGGLGMPDLENH